MKITDDDGISIAARIERASPAEVTPVYNTLDARWGAGLAAPILGDKAYDSNQRDAKLAAMGVEMVCPNRINRIKKTQNRQALRRLKHR